MAKETFYFTHDYEPTSDPKIQAMVGQYGAFGYGLYWRIVEMMHSDSSHCLPEKQYIYLAIAKQMIADAKQIEAFITDCIDVFELFYRENNCVFCARVLRNIATRKEISDARKAAGSKGGIAKAKQIVASANQNVAKKRENKENENKENELTLPFQSDNFKKMWLAFVQSRKAIKKPFKSIDQQNMCLQKLFKDCAGNEQSAVDSIESAIANGYQGLFPKQPPTPQQAQLPIQQQQSEIEADRQRILQRNAERLKRQVHE